MPSITTPAHVAHFLLAADSQDLFLNRIHSQAWVRIWGSTKQRYNIDLGAASDARRRWVSRSDTLFSELVPLRLAARELGDSSWRIVDDPEAICGYVAVEYQGRSRKRYARFGREDGRELLVLHRRFHGLAPERIEIAESFRLWHNLVEEKRDADLTVLCRFDGEGDREEVVRIGPNGLCVDVELSALLHFLAARKMALAIFFAFQRQSDVSYEEAGCPTESWEKAFPGAATTMRWVAVSDRRFGGDWNAFTQLTGKKLLMNQQKISSPYDRRGSDGFPAFSIGRGSDGQEILSTCDPDRLANNFGKNKDNAHYLTPVFFRKEVLAKYTNQPGKYSISDSRLQCRSLWSVMIDNNHDRYVAVFLGDLGRDLPPKERIYWQSFNVVTDTDLSPAFARRNLLGEFSETDRSEFLFKRLYEDFNTEWTRRWGWALFRSPSTDDAHVFGALHVPLTDEQKEFDEQVLNLCKLMIDSLNEEDITKRIVGTVPPDSKGIAKLDLLLKEQGGAHDSVITFLRGLQNLRSAGAAHLKGSKYQRVIDACGLAGLGKVDAFSKLIANALAAVQSLRKIEPRSVVEPVVGTDLT